MEFTDKDFKRIASLLLIFVLGILVFFLLKPIILSVIGGLILAYTFSPLYKTILKYVKEKNLSAVIVCLLAIAIIVVPAYFVAPLMIQQVFELFRYTQTLNMQGFLETILPTASESFIVQMTATANSIISTFSSIILNSLVKFLFEIPTIMFHLLIVAFVFFFTLRDGDKLKEFVSTLSPLNKMQERKLVGHFKDITNSVVYGQVLIGLVQGLLAGLGFFIFSIPKALILTILAVTLSIIPLLGPLFVWIPAAVYLYLQGNMTLTIVYILYNLLIVSTIDNLLRLYIVSRKTKLSQVIVLIGMIGGLFIFGILGLILGPLILAYFIVILEAYRQNTLSSLFKIEKDEEIK